MRGLIRKVFQLRTCEKMIFCKICGYKAVINRSQREHKEYTKLYCTCKNKDCAHKFVIHLTFSHTTKPSKLEEQNYFKYIITNLPDDKKQELRSMLSA